MTNLGRLGRSRPDLLAERDVEEGQPEVEDERDPLAGQPHELHKAKRALQAQALHHTRRNRLRAGAAGSNAAARVATPCPGPAAAPVAATGFGGAAASGAIGGDLEREQVGMEVGGTQREGDLSGARRGRVVRLEGVIEGRG